MATNVSTRTRNLRQAYALLLLGAVCLLLAWLWHPATGTYPLGVLVLGLGMSIATLLNPHRLAAASCLLAPLGLAVFLFFNHTIPGNQVFPAYIIALGLGLLACALLARHGYIGQGPVTPGLIVLGVGVVEYLLIGNYLPHNFVPFMLSFWLPGIGLLLLGMLYLVASLKA
ncbi:MAG: hypothetical protein ABI234_00555 [Ktedonobacteraceae bacterium]